MGCPFKYMMQTFIVMFIMSLIHKYFFSNEKNEGKYDMNSNLSEGNKEFLRKSKAKNT